MTLEELAGVLASRGLITEPSLAIDPPPPGGGSPWYVSVMMGCCAWFAGLFLFAFLLIPLGDFIFHSGRERWDALLILGVICCVAATLMYAAAKETSSFLNQFALAVSYAGQIGMALGLGGLGSERVAIWGMVVVEAVLTFVVRNRLHRFLTSLGTVIAWAVATHELIFRELPGSELFTSKAGPSEMSVVSIVVWIVIWAPVAYGAWWLVRNEGRWMAAGEDALVRPATNGLIAALSIAPLATHPVAFWMALGFHHGPDVPQGSTALWPLLAILLAMLSMALGFALRNRALIGLAILFGLLELSAFYYVLGTTLLLKSVIMILLGAILIGAAQPLARASK
jgi:hypothetical protein